MAENPFAHPSTLPYQLPPFDRVSNADYRPGFEAGMREQRAEVQNIAAQPGRAGFPEHRGCPGALRADAGPRVGGVFQPECIEYRPADAGDRFARSPRKLQAHEDAIYPGSGAVRAGGRRLCAPRRVAARQ